ncbi:MAG: hypothetical protein CL725_08985 [Chloroflexi bacterium]|nr:hypothetical protein [Chloroflexota bacterium]
MAKMMAKLALLIGMSVCAAKTMAVPIYDSMPVDLATAPRAVAETSFTWREFATGFTVQSAGYVTHIDTGITPTTSPLNPLGSWHGFHVGMADNTLVTTPSPLGGDNTPVGSLWQTYACSSVQTSPYIAPGCGWATPPGATGLGDGEFFSADVNVYLPSAGTYWVYLWLRYDDTVTAWAASETKTTDLFAVRQGWTVYDAAHPEYRQYVRQDGQRSALGLRIEFTAAPVPEAHSYALMLSGMCVLACLRIRRRRNI